MQQPYAPFLRHLDVVKEPILPKHLYQATDVQKSPYNNQPVGTGPFMCKEYTKGNPITFVCDPHDFKAGLPYLDQVIFKIIPPSGTAALALEQGEIDYLSWSSPATQAIKPTTSTCVSTSVLTALLPSSSLGICSTSHRVTLARHSITANP
jgi:ABC-type transport system substrate-binding protein